jgi:hypothetical protein
MRIVSKSAYEQTLACSVTPKFKPTSDADESGGWPGTEVYGPDENGLWGRVRSETVFIEPSPVIMWRTEKSVLMHETHSNDS